MDSIYEYTDYREYLKDLIREKKHQKSSYSIRLLSIKSGIKSPGFLSMVLNNKRNITEELAQKIAAALGLGKKEERYFLLMVEYTHTKRIESKHDILQQMLMLSRTNPVRNLLPDQFDFYDKWYYSVIRELVEVTEVSDSNVDRIAELLEPQLKPREVRQALEILTRLGLIHKNEKGQYKRNDTLVSCGEDVRSVVIGKYQTTMIELSSAALQKVPREQRDFSTVTLSIDNSAFLQIKDCCSRFRKEILGIASHVENPDSIFQINIQCFPVLKVNQEKIKAAKSSTAGKGASQ
ncbi:MAG TPA: TIGR02147 family protein [Chitinispirillaceae bacterium]|nr:TIGR02147 family protein [Chitinispirillaceae bacterium]